jgi:hypothetical protein
MFVRLVIHKNDEVSGRRQGLFQALSDLEYESSLLKHEQAQYDEIYEWFRKHLKKPSSFTRSSKPHAKNVALSWFKDTAIEHIAKMHALAQILEAHNISIDILQSERPGYLVYEDEFQIVAEPFKDTAT